MQYKSSIALLGIPVVHVAIGPAPGTGTSRGIAKGWVAIGDVAFGIVLAIGGVAVGGLSIGGVSVGALAIAGLSAGIWSLGGLALGVFAVGGAALGLSAATGGLAVAVEYAVGGVAIGSHANDEVAQAYFRSGGFFSFTDQAMRSLDWIIAVTAGIAVVVWIFGRGGKSSGWGP